VARGSDGLGGKRRGTAGETVATGLEGGASDGRGAQTCVRAQATLRRHAMCSGELGLRGTCWVCEARAGFAMRERDWPGSDWDREGGSAGQDTQRAQWHS
jgi:hypothetical protein